METWLSTCRLQTGSGLLQALPCKLFWERMFGKLSFEPRHTSKETIDGTEECSKQSAAAFYIGCE